MNKITNRWIAERFQHELSTDKIDQAWALVFMEYFSELSFEVETDSGVVEQVQTNWDNLFRYCAPSQLRAKGLLPQQLAISDFQSRYNDIAGSIGLDDPCQIAKTYLILVITKARMQSSLAGKAFSAPGPGNIEKMSKWLASAINAEV